MHLLARRAEAAADEALEFERELRARVLSLAPALVEEPGVGLVVTPQMPLRVSTLAPADVKAEIR